MAKKIENIFNAPRIRTKYSEGAKSKGILDDHAVRHNIDSREGTIQHIPTAEDHITNKEYVDVQDDPADAHIVSNGSSHVNVRTNTTHTEGDGSDHADVATNTAASHSNATDHTAGTDPNDHTESHSVASHNDTTATGTETETLTDGSDADALHAHATNDTHVAGDGSDHADVASNTLANHSGASRVRAKTATALVLPNSGPGVKLEFDVEDFDSLGEWDHVTNFNFTATNTGYYMVVCKIVMASVAWTAGNMIVFKLFKNNVYVQNLLYHQVEANITKYMPCVGMDLVYLTAGDYIHTTLGHNRTGGNCALHNDDKYNYIAIHRLS